MKIVSVKSFVNYNNNSCQQKISFKDTSSVALSDNRVSALSTESKQEKKKEQSLLRALGLISVGTLATLLLIPKMAAKRTSTSSNKVMDLSYSFKSLSHNDEIPTLGTCKSINKKLKDFLQNQVDYFNASPEILRKTGMPVSANRLLMYGEPGTGKSYFAKILAKTLDADYMEIKYSDLNKQYCGEHLENMKDIFEKIISSAQLTPKKKFVVNFNEIDAIAQSPYAIHGSGSHSTFKLEERSVFLTYIEDLGERAPNVILIGSTNMSPKIGRLDEAVLSRFKNVIEVTSPDKECMLEALKTHIETLPEGKMFINQNQRGLEEFAQSLVDRKASFRDLDNVINNSKNYYLKDALKDKNCIYKLEYLERAKNSLESTDGEIFGKK